jgi:hypothetical protein
MHQQGDGAYIIMLTPCFHCDKCQSGTNIHTDISLHRHDDHIFVILFIDSYSDYSRQFFKNKLSFPFLCNLRLFFKNLETKTQAQADDTFFSNY